jgi:hypothetical protein
MDGTCSTQYCSSQAARTQVDKMGNNKQFLDL